MPFVALHTADPVGGNQSTHEASYKNYKRLACGSYENIADLSFPECVSGNLKVTHFSIGEDETGPGRILLAGAFSLPIDVKPGVAPIIRQVDTT